MHSAIPVLLVAAAIDGQGPAPAPAPLRFEVATIKPSKDGGGKGGLDLPPGGGLKMQGVTLKNLIAFAYDKMESQVSGGPKWIDSAAYDVLARPERPEAGDVPKGVVAPGTTAWDRVRLRTQALLAERFHLVIHKTSRDVQGYALVQVKDGAKLKPNPQDDNRPPGTMRSRGRIDGRNGSIHMLCAVFTNWLGRPVVDRTGLTATYDYKLEYAQEQGDPGDAPGDAAQGASLFMALQEQLGLKLEPAKVPVESIVVDRAERPTAN